MRKRYLINFFNCNNEKEAESLVEAIKIAKAAGFECVIYRANEEAAKKMQWTPIANWSLLRGLEPRRES